MQHSVLFKTLNQQCLLLHWSVSQAAGNTGRSDAVPGWPVSPGIYPAYVPVNSLILALAAAQPVLTQNCVHHVDKHVIDSSYYGAGNG